LLPAASRFAWRLFLSRSVLLFGNHVLLCRVLKKVKNTMRQLGMSNIAPTRTVDTSFDLCRISHAKQNTSLCSNTIRAYFRQGLGCYRRGKVVFFSKTELEAFIRKGKVAQ
jgi:hypothetical protein